jgi:hypothetical protein
MKAKTYRVQLTEEERKRLQDITNGKSSRVKWQFTTADARIKLRALYHVV